MQSESVQNSDRSVKSMQRTVEMLRSLMREARGAGVSDVADLIALAAMLLMQFAYGVLGRERLRLVVALLAHRYREARTWERRSSASIAAVGDILTSKAPAWSPFVWKEVREDVGNTRMLEEAGQAAAKRVHLFGCALTALGASRPATDDPVAADALRIRASVLNDLQVSEVLTVARLAELIATRYGEDPETVRDHIRVLETCGLVEIGVPLGSGHLVVCHLTQTALPQIADFGVDVVALATMLPAVGVLALPEETAPAPATPPNGKAETNGTRKAKANGKAQTPARGR